jgi:hypothetical protein
LGFWWKIKIKNINAHMGVILQTIGNREQKQK